MNTEKKTFAFRLAEKRPNNPRWKAREGVSVASCSFVSEGVYWYPNQGPIRDGKYEC
jgi:hypothetical protein